MSIKRLKEAIKRKLSEEVSSPLKRFNYRGFVVNPEDGFLQLYTREEWAYGKGYRSPEWEAGNEQEARDWIDSYHSDSVKEGYDISMVPTIKTEDYGTVALLRSSNPKVSRMIRNDQLVYDGVTKSAYDDRKFDVYIDEEGDYYIIESKSPRVKSMKKSSRAIVENSRMFTKEDIKNIEIFLDEEGRSIGFSKGGGQKHYLELGRTHSSSKVLRSLKNFQSNPSQFLNYLKNTFYDYGPFAPLMDGEGRS